MRDRGFIALGGLALALGAVLTDLEAGWQWVAALAGIWLMAAGTFDKGPLWLHGSVALIAALTTLWESITRDWTLGLRVAIAGAVLATVPLIRSIRERSVSGPSPPLD